MFDNTILSFESLGHQWARLSGFFFPLQLQKLDIVIIFKDCSNSYTVTWLTWFCGLVLEDKYKVIMTAVTNIQYCVPVGREKDIRARYLKLISNKKL